MFSKMFTIDMLLKMIIYANVCITFLTKTIPNKLWRVSMSNQLHRISEVELQINFFNFFNFRFSEVD